MKDYKMVVEIPVKNVPDEISIQEAKVTAEIWLTQKVPDMKLMSFEVLGNDKSKVKRKVMLEEKADDPIELELDYRRSVTDVGETNG